MTVVLDCCVLSLSLSRLNSCKEESLTFTLVAEENHRKMMAHTAHTALLSFLLGGLLAVMSVGYWFTAFLLCGSAMCAILGYLVGVRYLARGRLTIGDTFDPEGNRRRRCREPAVFTGEEEKFSEWLFSVEEALRVLRPEEPVGYVASFLDGNARKWLVSSWGPEASRRPASWKEFRTALKEAFAERYAEEKGCVRLFRTKQQGSLEEYITEFMGVCLTTEGVDDLAKTTLFIEGLASPEIKKEVRREHPQRLENAIRAARTARISQDDVSQERDGGIAAMHGQRARGGGASNPERQRLFREGRCYCPVTP